MLKHALINLRDILFPEYALKRKRTYFNAILHESVKIYNSTEILNNSGHKERIKVGKGSHIVGLLQVFDNCGEIIIGESSFIGEGTRIMSAAKIEIGNNVQLAHNINIFDSNIHSLNPIKRQLEFVTNLTKGLIKLHDIKEQSVRIKDNVWIGASSIILKGVTIGNNSIIGAGSVVVKDVPPNVIVVGNPAKIVREITF